MKSRIVKLGDVCRFIRGVTFEKEKATTRAETGRMPILRAGNIGDELDIQNDLVWVPDELVSDEQTLRRNDVAICMSSGSPEVVGKTARVSSNLKASIGSFCGIIRPMDGEDPGYLSFFFRSGCFRRHRDAIARGANIQNLRFSELEQIQLDLPDLAEQKRIAAILERADRLRRLRRYGLEMASNFVETAFISVIGNPNARNSPIEKVPLASICTRITDGTHRTPKYIASGVPFLSVKNVNTPTGELDFDDVKYISREEHEELTKRCKPEYGDILYTKVGATYGIPKLVTTRNEFSIFVSLALIKPDSAKVLPKYLEAVLATNFVFRQAQERISGIAVPDLHLIEIREFTIPLPRIPLQEEFVRLLNKHDRVKALHREALRQAEHLFQTLLERAFTSGL